MRIKIISFFLYILLLISPISVFAEDITCDYKDGFQLYYKNGNVGLNNEKFQNEWWHYGSFLYKSGYTNAYIENEIKILDQEEIKKKLGNYACPTPTYICEVSNWGIELPSIVSLAETAGVLVTTILDGFTMDWLDLTQYYSQDRMWSLLQLDNKAAYIMGEKRYKEEYKPYIGVNFNSVLGENYETSAEWCTFLDGTWFEWAPDLVCGAVGGIAETIADLVASNDEMLVGVKIVECTRYNYEGKYIGINPVCYQLDLTNQELDKYITEYNECGSNETCKTAKQSSINRVSEELKQHCSANLKNLSYNEVERPCIDICLGLSAKIDKILEFKKTECGFSSNLVIWIANVIRWIKYIVPVIVIVFGMIDFIKAMSSNKEDEMKKAQQKFIKRLIAALLIFIIPFIIEFILNKMGFDSNGCGIINL